MVRHDLDDVELIVEDNSDKAIKKRQKAWKKYVKRCGWTH